MKAKKTRAKSARRAKAAKPKHKSLRMVICGPEEAAHIHQNIYVAELKRA